MKNLSKIEVKILKNLSSQNELKIEDFDFLEEADNILKVRELVYYIDNLIERGFIKKSDYYEYNENDKMNFKYLNNAISIDFNKLEIEDELRDVFSIKSKSEENIIFVVFTYILTFILGMAAMYVFRL